MPERNPGSLGGDFLAIGLQIAAVMAIPLLVAVYIGISLDERWGTRPWLLLVSIFVGIGLAGVLSFVVLRRYWQAQPAPRVSEEARTAGRRWQAEIEERERRREAGEEE
ncbi:MAG TPA: AtpZ/AtpI family protein [Candidatus Dormibacteraeota bacterium]|nr:AtpZ/AtpI family protein [Candidatus Dormibacteraeota bacterium]